MLARNAKKKQNNFWGKKNKAKNIFHIMLIILLPCNVYM